MAKKSSGEFQVGEHALVPKHEKCSDKEKQEVLERYHAQPNQMPRILSTDVAIAELGAKAGDLIKITRTSSTAGQVVFYRIVVE